MRKIENDELGRLDVETYKLTAKHDITVVLDNIRSLNNIGSVFRTADAFKLRSILLCGITAQPPHRDIRKTALGATETVEWRYVQDVKEAILSLKAEGRKILLIEQVEGATSLEQYQPPASQSFVLVFGNEVKGISEEILELADEFIELPQYGTKHSLNISVCAGIVIWDVVSKLGLLE